MLAAEARDRVTLLEHTADLGLEIEAPTIDALYEASVLGLVDVIVDSATVKPRSARVLRLAAEDRELLLVKLLQEVLYGYDTERWLPARAAVRTAPGGLSLEARLEGETFDASRHAVKTEVKAVTYHALEVRETGDGLRARLVLDL